MINVVHTTEHELKKGLDESSYNVWTDKLREKEKDSQMTISYSAEEPEVGKELFELASEIPLENKIFVYGECLEKGGGGEGILPTVSQFHTYCIVITISAIAAKVFLDEFLKDVYENTLHKLFESRKKSQLNKTVALQMTVRNTSVTYLFESSLTTDECVVAIKAINEHLKSLGKMEDVKRKIFVYLPSEKQWVEL